VLIAPDLVLTAAHCLYGGGEDYAAPDGLRFRAGLRDGVALADSGAARAVVHPAYSPGGDAATHIRYDVGLIQLAQPVSLSTAAPFQAVRLADVAQDLTVVSYGQGRDEALSWDEDCTMLGRQQGLIDFLIAMSPLARPGRPSSVVPGGGPSLSRSCRAASWMRAGGSRSAWSFRPPSPS